MLNLPLRKKTFKLACSQKYPAVTCSSVAKVFVLQERRLYWRFSVTHGFFVLDCICPASGSPAYITSWRITMMLYSLLFMFLFCCYTSMKYDFISHVSTTTHPHPFKAPPTPPLTKQNLLLLDLDWKGGIHYKEWQSIALSFLFCRRLRWLNLLIDLMTVLHSLITVWFMKS